MSSRMAGAWQERGLSVFYLPAYSPPLNIAEVLWRKLKQEWLRAEDYADNETLKRPCATRCGKPWRP